MQDKKFITSSDVKLMKRRPESHKGDNGKVLAVGGSIRYVGAIILAGIAAYRSGVDLVVIAAPEKIALAINFWPDFITIKMKGEYLVQGHAKEIINASNDYDVLLIGNGIGQEQSTKQFAMAVIKKTSCKKVIDADAIKAISLRDAKNSIITPHRKEFEILLKNSGIKPGRSMEKILPELQEKLDTNVILLKGKVDMIISKDRVAYNKTGNSGMTKGGTGDVLAGLCAGIVAQGNPLFESACAAAYINGKAGDLLYKEYGYGFTATELADRVSVVIKKWL